MLSNACSSKIVYMAIIDLEKDIKTFFELDADYDYIYNEFSLQFELGIYLRNKYPDCKVYFERNVKHLEITKKLIKTECDLVIVDKEGNKYSIELKHPRNGAFPKRMGQCIEDIMFAEQLKNKGFVETYAIALVDTDLNKGFYDGRKKDGIYSYFRNKNRIIGKIEDKQNKKEYSIDGGYEIERKDINNYNNKYYVVKGKKTKY